MHAFTKRLQGYGRFGDKLLAHLSPKEAKILKKAGGAGTVNPFTGALEYYKGTLGGGGVNPFAGDTMPGDETTPVNTASTMSTGGNVDFTSPMYDYMKTSNTVGWT